MALSEARPIGRILKDCAAREMGLSMTPTQDSGMGPEILHFTIFQVMLLYFE